MLSAAAILAIAVIGGIIPLYAARNEFSRRFFSLGNAFAGGLFLGVGFIHLLPEGIEKLEGYGEYPLAMLLAALGLGILLLIDRVIFGDHHQVAGTAESPQHSIYPYVLLILLSIHSIIAGISLGIESHLTGLVIILLGILCHKGSAAFALMVSIHRAGIAESRQKAMLAIFVLMTPLGIFAGMAAHMAMGPSVEVSKLVEGCFNALAAGTFIYVAIVDIIDEELSRRNVRVAKFVMSVLAGEDDQPMPTRDRDRMIKFVLVVLGIMLMALLVQWAHGGH